MDFGEKKIPSPLLGLIRQNFTLDICIGVMNIDVFQIWQSWKRFKGVQGTSFLYFYIEEQNGT